MKLSGKTTTLVVQPDCKVVIPPKIVKEMGLDAGSKAVLLKHGKTLTLAPEGELIPLLDILSNRMVEAIKSTEGLEPDAELLFGLTVEEYARLSETEISNLWEKNYKKESERLDGLDKAAEKS